MKLIAPKGFSINPKRTRVAKCVRKLKRRKGVRSAYAVCQKATKQSYRTGRTLKRGRVVLAGQGFRLLPGSSARSQFYAYLRGQGVSAADARATTNARFPVRAKNPSPYKYLVSMGGTHLARFLTLQHAKQYGQALANRYGRQVRVTG